MARMVMLLDGPVRSDARVIRTVRSLAALGRVKGWNDGVMDMVRKVLVFGDADTVGEYIAEAVGMGLDGITVDLPVNGHNLERVELLGEVALKALG